MADKQQQGTTGTDAIAPAQVTLNAQPPDARPRDAHGQPAHASRWRQYRLTIAGLAVSLLALLAVIFVLPDLITPVPTPAPVATDKAGTAEKSSADGASAGNASTGNHTRAAGPTESPWQDAQFAKARRETQEILQRLLEKQKALEAIRVDLWAGEDYGQATQLAKTADRHYQQQAFPQARQLYQSTLATFTQMLERSESVFQAAVRQGQQALLDGDAALARERFQLAAHIKPGDAAVQTGLQRAAVLGDVLAAIDAGEKLQRDGQLAAAQERYQAALALDEQSRLAQTRLRDVDRAIADRDFGRHMSAGFSAMSAADHGRAIAAFKRALNIKPDAADAQNALKQAQNEQTQTSLRRLLEQARQHEGNEQWQDATNRYEQALAIDRNLVEARVGAIRAGTRADIDRNLEAILSSPERLTTPAVHQEYQAFRDDILGIKNPGPRLTRQLEQLGRALQLAVQPVTVRLKSDNATQVTLYKVGQLGNFSHTEVTLKPGTYTIVGTREGYRDVRREFTVSASGGADSSPITIQCEEKISQG